MFSCPPQRLSSHVFQRRAVFRCGACGTREWVLSLVIFSSISHTTLPKTALPPWGRVDPNTTSKGFVLSAGRIRSPTLSKHHYTPAGAVLHLKFDFGAQDPPVTNSSVKHLREFPKHPPLRFSISQVDLGRLSVGASNTTSNFERTLSYSSVSTQVGGLAMCLITNHRWNAYILFVGPQQPSGAHM
ncbi:hypothetical protein BJ322DRAFT_529328 [Thelephora terrestris]|uniref:Uncharacterized protein n=1 Tax=Thelephora terrestris TaxID=56493 RepID=A0A9P6LAF6_9AGAM|nr:hypothetical protein BJ322DRAFT_529328 [Thelephora terrestris]